MAKIKIQAVDAVTFKLGGKVFLKGDYRIGYVETVTDNTTGVVTGENANESLVILLPKSGSISTRDYLPFKNPRPWTDFLDSTGASYASFDAFTTALGGIVSKA